MVLLVKLSGQSRSGRRRQGMGAGCRHLPSTQMARGRGPRPCVRTDPTGDPTEGDDHRATRGHGGRTRGGGAGPRRHRVACQRVQATGARTVPDPAQPPPLRQGCTTGATGAPSVADDRGDRSHSERVRLEVRSDATTVTSVRHVAHWPRCDGRRCRRVKWWGSRSNSPRARSLPRSQPPAGSSSRNARRDRPWQADDAQLNIKHIAFCI